MVKLMDREGIQMHPLAIETQWPELFEGLTEEDRNSIVQVLAVSWQEGFEITRESVQDLTDHVRKLFPDKYAE